jgi:RNA polymerase sigma-70 factor (ECF subfamily)
MASPNHSDAALVQAARDSDRDAFVELLERHRGLVLGICSRILRDRFLAEDAFQEAALRGWLSLNSLRDPSRFGSWLAGIALNVCHESLRAQKGERNLSWEELAGGALVEQSDLTPGPEDIFEARQLQERLKDGLAALPDGQRQAAVLFYLEGLTQEEIAQLLGTHASAIKTRLQRARRKLREILERPKEDEVKTVEWVPMDLVDVRVVRNPDQPALYGAVLSERGRDRKLVIFMGEFEGISMAMQLEKVERLRPMTFRFMGEVLQVADANIDEVRIEKLQDRTYFAVVLVRGSDGTKEVDARPSDALNLALATGARIVAHPDVLDTTGITPESDVWRKLVDAEATGKGSEKIVRKMVGPSGGSWE